MMRRVGRVWVSAVALSYWLAAMPPVADALATRFHASNSQMLTVSDLDGVQAIVVLGAGIRTMYGAGNNMVAVPDAQTVYNAMEAARLYHLSAGRLPVVASGGKQDGAPPEATESGILKEWLERGGVPAAQIVLESGSRNTREQAILVMPMLQAKGWRRFALVTPAVQGPRAATVFRLRGGDPVLAPAPVWPEDARGRAHSWTPNGTALRVSERSTYDYLAWGYYWLRGWLRT